MFNFIFFGWGNPRTKKVSCRSIDPIRLIIDLVTVGITALFFYRVQIEKRVCDLDVGLGYL